MQYTCPLFRPRIEYKERSQRSCINLIMFWTAVCAVLLILASLFGIPQQLWGLYRRGRAVRDIPGWPTHWFWGNLHQLWKMDQEVTDRRTAYIQETRHKVTRLWIGPFMPAVQVTHSDSIRKVMKLPKYTETVYDLFLPWLGDGLLIADGKKWLRNRRLLTPAFHFEILKGYVPVMNNCLEMFIKKWRSSARENIPVCVFNDVSKLSLDIIMRCAFSNLSDCQLSDSHPYLKAVSQLLDLIKDRFFNILYRSDFIYYLSPSGRKFKKACRIAHNYTESTIRERKQALGIEGTGVGEETEAVLRRASEQRKYLDFLDILLTARDEDGKGLTDLEIRDEADTFMFEGHDTTTSGMSWTLYCLAKHPEHQDKVREEVRSVLMGREWLEYDDLKDLQYTTWCIKEAMRLYTPVYDIVRRTTEDIEIEGHVIPKDMMIICELRTIHKHPDIWENPNEYNPLRFHPTNAEDRDPYAYMPFSAGYRNCIGQNFALNEEKMVISSIIHRFIVSLDETHKVEEVARGVLRTKNDIKMKLEPVV